RRKELLENPLRLRGQVARRGDPAHPSQRLRQLALRLSAPAHHALPGKDHMETMKLSAETRQESSKGAVRRLRATRKIPAVAYGPKLETLQLTISPKDVTSVLATERGRNSVIELSVGADRKLTVLLTDFQYHPVTRALLHADFREIKENEPID